MMYKTIVSLVVLAAFQVMCEDPAQPTPNTTKDGGLGVSKYIQDLLCKDNTTVITELMNVMPDSIKECFESDDAEHASMNSKEMAMHLCEEDELEHLAPVFNCIMKPLCDSMKPIMSLMGNATLPFCKEEPQEPKE